MSDHVGDANKMVFGTPRMDRVRWNHHYANLEGSKLERELNEANNRIKRLESWIASLDKLAQHSGKSENREWFGSEIGWLHRGHVVYLGEAKP